MGAGVICADVGCDAITSDDITAEGDANDSFRDDDKGGNCDGIAGGEACDCTCMLFGVASSPSVFERLRLNRLKGDLDDLRGGGVALLIFAGRPFRTCADFDLTSVFADEVRRFGDEALGLTARLSKDISLDALISSNSRIDSRFGATVKFVSERGKACCASKLAAWSCGDSGKGTASACNDLSEICLGIAKIPVGGCCADDKLGVGLTFLGLKEDNDVLSSGWCGTRIKPSFDSVFGWMAALTWDGAWDGAGDGDGDRDRDCADCDRGGG